MSTMSEAETKCASPRAFLTPYSISNWKGSVPWEIVSDIVKLGCCPYCLMRFLNCRIEKLYRLQESVLVNELCSGSVSDTSEDRAFAEGLRSLFLARPTCVVCLDILPPSTSLLNCIRTTVEKADYQFDSFSVFKTIPASIIIRQWGMWAYLHHTYGIKYPSTLFVNATPEQRIVEPKEATKWIHTPHIAAAIARMGRGDRDPVEFEKKIQVLAATALSELSQDERAAVAEGRFAAPPAQKPFVSEGLFRVHMVFMTEPMDNEVALRSELDRKAVGDPSIRRNASNKGGVGNAFSVNGNLMRLLPRVSYETLTRLKFAPPSAPARVLSDSSVVSISAPPVSHAFYSFASSKASITQSSSSNNNNSSTQSSVSATAAPSSTSTENAAADTSSHLPSTSTSTSSSSSVSTFSSASSLLPSDVATADAAAVASNASDSDDSTAGDKKCTKRQRREATLSSTTATTTTTTANPTTTGATAGDTSASDDAVPVAGQIVSLVGPKKTYTAFRDAVFGADDRAQLPRAWEIKSHTVATPEEEAAATAAAATATATAATNQQELDKSSASSLPSSSIPLPPPSSAAFVAPLVSKIRVMAVEGAGGAPGATLMQISSYACAEVFCSHASVLVEGSYLKLSRVISQTEWTAATASNPNPQSSTVYANSLAAAAAAAAAAAGGGGGGGDGVASGTSNSEGAAESEEMKHGSGGAGNEGRNSSSGGSGAGGDDEEEGGPVAESSVDVEIGRHIIPLFKPGMKFKFHASGREDLNVRMLGGGRPFFLEICDPHRLIDPKDTAFYKTLEEKVNASTRYVQVRNLRAGSNSSFDLMTKGITEKRKKYRCVVYSERALDGPSDLNPINGLEGKEIEITQQTPIRVIFRRSAMARKRTVNGLKATYLGPHWFILDLETQAGTYVKEFVHSDRGRTVPSCSAMLNTPCTIIQLDVTDLIL